MVAICIGVRGGGSAAPPGLKIFRANSVFRASTICSKIRNDKRYFNTVKNSRATLFSGQAQVAQKSWMSKVYSIQWKISGYTLFFRESTGCSKILNVKNIFNTVNLGQLFFQGKRKVAQNSWLVKSIFNTVKNFRANYVFKASASC